MTAIVIPSLGNATPRVLSLKRPYTTFYMDARPTHVQSSSATDHTWRPCFSISFAAKPERKPKDNRWTSEHGIRFASSAKGNGARGTNVMESGLVPESGKISMSNSQSTRDLPTRPRSYQATQQAESVAFNVPRLSQSNCSVESDQQARHAPRERLWAVERGIKFGSRAAPHAAKATGSATTRPTCLSQSGVVAWDSVRLRSEPARSLRLQQMTPNGSYSTQVAPAIPATTPGPATPLLVANMDQSEFEAARLRRQRILEAANMSLCLSAAVNALRGACDVARLVDELNPEHRARLQGCAFNDVLYDQHDLDNRQTTFGAIIESCRVLRKIEDPSRISQMASHLHETCGEGRRHLMRYEITAPESWNLRDFRTVLLHVSLIKRAYEDLLHACFESENSLKNLVNLQSAFERKDVYSGEISRTRHIFYPWVSQRHDLMRHPGTPLLLKGPPGYRENLLKARRRGKQSFAAFPDYDYALRKRLRRDSVSGELYKRKDEIMDWVRWRRLKVSEAVAAERIVPANVLIKKQRSQLAELIRRHPHPGDRRKRKSKVVKIDRTDPLYIKKVVQRPKNRDQLGAAASSCYASSAAISRLGAQGLRLRPSERRQHSLDASYVHDSRLSDRARSITTSREEPLRLGAREKPSSSLLMEAAMHRMSVPSEAPKIEPGLDDTNTVTSMPRATASSVHRPQDTSTVQSLRFSASLPRRGMANAQTHDLEGLDLHELFSLHTISARSEPRSVRKTQGDVTTESSWHQVEDVPIDDGLAYRIDRDVLRRGMNANALLEKPRFEISEDSGNTPPGDSRQPPLPTPLYWDHNFYTTVDGAKPTVHYCRKIEQAEREAQAFLNESVVGFDLEWATTRLYGRSTIKDNVSLMQVASESRIALFHIALHRGDSAEGLLAPSLKKLIESPNIIKVGVNISGDFTRIRNNLGVEGMGVFELSNLHKVVKYSEQNPELVNLKLVRLGQQVHEHLLLPLDKGPDVRESDWSKELSMEQIRYAASDAYAGLRLYHVLDAKRKLMSPVPELPECVDRRRQIAAAKKTANTRRSAPLNSTGAVNDATAPEVLLDADDNELSEEDFTTAPSSPIFSTPPESPVLANVSTSSVSSPAPKSTSRPTRVAPELAAADQWVEDYLAKLASQDLAPHVKGRRHLRSYALWHHQNLSIDQIAKSCQISKITAAGYVLDAIFIEGESIREGGRLDWDAERCKDVCRVLGFSEERGEDGVRVLAFRRFGKLWRSL
ncbi:MAG: hypothetical protein M1828_000120 [Chrysothrix sp. TS-e1954]|nr:MAG: hypothetical protein M1828_000120 [Chrysothrix sp. TS-e1954]